MITNKIVHGKKLIAGDGKKRKIIRDGAVYIEDDFIRDVGKYEELSRKYSFAVKIGSEKHIVMPGLINSHHHGRGLSPLRAGIRDAPLEIWISYHLGHIYYLDVYYNTLLSCIKLIESGVTTTMHHFYGHNPEELPEYEKDLENVIRAYIDSGMRVSLAPSIQDQNKYVYMHEEKFVSQLPTDIRNKLLIQIPEDNEISNRVKSYFKAFKKVFKSYHNYENRIKLLLGPTGVHWCSDDLLQKIKKEAQKYGIGIHMHLHETKYQKDYGFKVHGKSPLKHLEELDFLGPEVSFAHCIWVTKEDIDILAKTKPVVVHNPSSNLRLFSGIAPVISMIKKGVNVAIGIDSTGINDDEDIFQEIRLCSIIHRHPGMNSYQRYTKTLNSSQLLDMATIEGAKATGFEGEIGAINIGAKADLILVNLKNIPYYLSPMIPMEEIIINWAKGTDVDTVIINGEIIMKDRQFTKLDKSSVLNTLKESIKDFKIEPYEKLEKYREYIKKYYKTWDKNSKK